MKRRLRIASIGVYVFGAAILVSSVGVAIQGGYHPSYVVHDAMAIAGILLVWATNRRLP